MDAAGGGVVLLPPGADWVLLAALVAYSGHGGVGNITLANWARDKGYGMGGRAGYIPAAVGGQKVHLADTGFTTGALPGMALPALLYVTFLPPGSDIRGPGISAALAERVGVRAGPLLAGGIAFLGAWILFETQLDNVEGMTRAITDILWTGSRRVRGWRGGDVRAVYYTVLAAIVLWGVIALRLAAPIVLLQLGANVAGVVFVVASLHLLYVNTRRLPPALRPPVWRRGALVAMAGFYAFFVARSALSRLR